MKTILKYLYVLSASAVLGGCVDDDTVNEFSELNKVTFQDLNDHYAVMLYDTLKIPLNIETTFKDESDLSYLWYLYEFNDRDKADTLGREKDLAVVIDPTHAIPGLEYTLVVKVTDNTTGVYYRKDMSLEVNSQFTKGTLLLCEDNGEAELNFLMPGGERELVENVYSRSNGGEKLGRNPRRVFCVDSRFRPDLKSGIILCEDERGGVCTDPVTFECKSEVKGMLMDESAGDMIQSQLYYTPSDFAMCDYMVANGKVFKRVVSMGENDWASPLVSTQGSSEYDVDEHVMVTMRQPTFYDRKNHRLLQHYNILMGALHELKADPADIKVFDPSNLGDHMEMLACDVSKLPTDNWMMMKDTQTGKIYCYKFKFVKKPGDKDYSFVSDCKLEITSSIAPHIGQARFFSTHPNFKDILMYSDGTKVYSLALGLLKDGFSSLQEAVQVDLESENMEITGFKLAEIKVAGPNSFRLVKTYQLRIYLQDNNLPAKKGGVRFYGVSTQGGIHSDLLFSRIGFCDKVVDVEEKYS